MYEVQIGDGGKTTLPLELIEKYNLEDGDMLKVVNFDGALVLIVPKVYDDANQSPPRTS